MGHGSHTRKPHASVLCCMEHVHMEQMPALHATVHEIQQPGPCTMDAGTPGMGSRAQRPTSLSTLGSLGLPAIV